MDDGVDSDLAEETKKNIRQFLESSQNSLQVMRDFFHVRSLEVTPPPESAFYLKDDRERPLGLHLPCDAVSGRVSLLTKSWEFDLVRFLGDGIRSQGSPVCFIDVGANVGLISRQLLRDAGQNISVLHAYEPNPRTFEILIRNLGGCARVNLHMAALANKAGKLDLHLDPQNIGNSSLVAGAVQGDHARMAVDVLSARAESQRWSSHDLPMFYKSDTQGFDQHIMAAFEPDFWRNVVGGVCEVWRLADLDFDRDRFAAVLDQYDRKVFRHSPDQRLSTLSIMKHLEAGDGGFTDLMFWNG